MSAVFSFTFEEPASRHIRPAGHDEKPQTTWPTTVEGPDPDGPPCEVVGVSGAAPVQSSGSHPEKTVEAVLGVISSHGPLRTLGHWCDADLYWPLNLLRNQKNLQEAAHLLAGSGSPTGTPVQRTEDKRQKTTGTMFKPSEINIIF